MASSSNRSVSVSLGGGFLGLLTIAFAALKLCGVVSWSWWAVLAPLWVPVVASVAVVLGVVAVAVVLGAVSTMRG